MIKIHVVNLYKNVNSNTSTLKAVTNYEASVSELRSKVEVFMSQLSVIESNAGKIKVQWGKINLLRTDMTVSETEHEAELSKLHTDAEYLKKLIDDLCKRIFRLEGNHMKNLD